MAGVAYVHESSRPRSVKSRADSKESEDIPGVILGTEILEVRGVEAIRVNLLFRVASLALREADIPLLEACLYDHEKLKKQHSQRSSMVSEDQVRRAILDQVLLIISNLRKRFEEFEELPKRSALKKIYKDVSVQIEQGKLTLQDMHDERLAARQEEVPVIPPEALQQYQSVWEPALREGIYRGLECGAGNQVFLTEESFLNYLSTRPLAQIQKDFRDLETSLEVNSQVAEDRYVKVVQQMLETGPIRLLRSQLKRQTEAYLSREGSLREEILKILAVNKFIDIDFIDAVSGSLVQSPLKTSSVDYETHRTLLHAWVQGLLKVVQIEIQNALQSGWDFELLTVNLAQRMLPYEETNQLLAKSMGSSAWIALWKVKIPEGLSAWEELCQGLNQELQRLFPGGEINRVAILAQGYGEGMAEYKIDRVAHGGAGAESFSLSFEAMEPFFIEILKNAIRGSEDFEQEVKISEVQVSFKGSEEDCLAGQIRKILNLAFHPEAYFSFLEEVLDETAIAKFELSFSKALKFLDFLRENALDNHWLRAWTFVSGEESTLWDWIRQFFFSRIPVLAEINPHQSLANQLFWAAFHSPATFHFAGEFSTFAEKILSCPMQQKILNLLSILMKRVIAGLGPDSKEELFKAIMHSQPMTGHTPQIAHFFIRFAMAEIERKLGVYYGKLRDELTPYYQIIEEVRVQKKSLEDWAKVWKDSLTDGLTLWGRLYRMLEGVFKANVKEVDFNLMQGRVWLIFEASRHRLKIPRILRDWDGLTQSTLGNSRRYGSESGGPFPVEVSELQVVPSPLAREWDDLLSELAINIIRGSRKPRAAETDTQLHTLILDKPNLLAGQIFCVLTSLIESEEIQKYLQELQSSHFFRPEPDPGLLGRALHPYFHLLSLLQRLSSQQQWLAAWTQVIEGDFSAWKVLNSFTWTQIAQARRHYGTVMDALIWQLVHRQHYQTSRRSAVEALDGLLASCQREATTLNLISRDVGALVQTRRMNMPDGTQSTFLKTLEMFIFFEGAAVCGYEAAVAGKLAMFHELIRGTGVSDARVQELQKNLDSERRKRERVEQEKLLLRRQVAKLECQTQEMSRALDKVRETLEITRVDLRNAQQERDSLLVDREKANVEICMLKTTLQKERAEGEQRAAAREQEAEQRALVREIEMKRSLEIAAELRDAGMRAKMEMLQNTVIELSTLVKQQKLRESMPFATAGVKVTTEGMGGAEKASGGFSPTGDQ